MAKWLVLCLLAVFLLYPHPSSAASAFGEGVIDKDLKYEGFEITKEGFLTGTIVNNSGGVRRGIRLDMWTTNAQETRIFWRKSFTIQELGPKGRYSIKEPYDLDGENPSRIKFMFRVPNAANFRN